MFRKEETRPFKLDKVRGDFELIHEQKEEDKLTFRSHIQNR